MVKHSLYGVCCSCVWGWSESAGQAVRKKKMARKRKHRIQWNLQGWVESAKRDQNPHPCLTYHHQDYTHDNEAVLQVNLTLIRLLNTHLARESEEPKEEMHWAQTLPDNNRVNPVCHQRCMWPAITVHALHSSSNSKEYSSSFTCDSQIPCKVFLMAHNAEKGILENRC